MSTSVTVGVATAATIPITVDITAPITAVITAIGHTIEPPTIVPITMERTTALTEDITDLPIIVPTGIIDALTTGPTGPIGALITGPIGIENIAGIADMGAAITVAYTAAITATDQSRHCVWKCGLCKAQLDII